jgi:hypothetical protein
MADGRTITGSVVVVENSSFATGATLDVKPHDASSKPIAMLGRKMRRRTYLL